MAFPSSGGFDYWAGGRALVTLAKDTGNLDYWLGGRPIAVGAPAAGASVAVLPDVGAVVITGLAPTVTVSNLVTVAPDVGAVEITGLAPTIAVTQNVVVEPGVGSIVIGGLAPTSAGGTAAPAATPEVGGGGRRRRVRRRVEVEIDGEVFEVASEQEGRDLLMQAREVAEQAAQAKAEKAIAKAQRKATPASQDRAFAVPAPKIAFSASGMDDELAQQVRAQVEAAQAAIDAIYERALSRARMQFVAMQQDEEDALAVLLLS